TLAVKPVSRNVVTRFPSAGFSDPPTFIPLTSRRHENAGQLYAENFAFGVRSRLVVGPAQTVSALDDETTHESSTMAHCVRTSATLTWKVRIAAVWAGSVPKFHVAVLPETLPSVPNSADWAPAAL